MAVEENVRNADQTEPTLLGMVVASAERSSEINTVHDCTCL